MITGIFKNGKLSFGDAERTKKAVWFFTKHTGERFWLDLMLPKESRQQRKFYHGAVIKLWIYLDGKDYKDSELQDKYHEWAKQEFNGESFTISGKTKIIGGSTKGKLNKGYIDRIIDFLEEQYGIDRFMVLDPKQYKYFNDVVYMNGEHEDYIDYLKALGRLK